MQTPTELLVAAADSIRKGQFAWAEALCRIVLDHDPSNAAAWNLLGVVAVSVNLHLWAMDYFRQATRADPRVEGFAKNLAALEALLAEKKISPSAFASKDGFLLVKSSGHGFWSEVNHVMGGLLTAEMTGRTPVIHWGNNSLFRDGSTDNAWDLYFEPVSQVTIDDLAKETSFYPPKWSANNLRADNVNRILDLHSMQTGINFLARSEKVVVSDYHIFLSMVMRWMRRGDVSFGRSPMQLYRQLVGRYLRPREWVWGLIESFYREHLSAAPFAAVHVRGSDKVIEQKDLEEVNRAYFEHIDELDRGMRIFLLTDSVHILNDFRTRYGDRIVVTSAERSSDEMGVHLRPGDGLRRGTEILLDSYLAAKAQKFIGNGASNVSGMIMHLKEWNDEDVTMVAPISMHRLRPFHVEPRCPK